MTPTYCISSSTHVRSFLEIFCGGCRACGPVGSVACGTTLSKPSRTGGKECGYKYAIPPFSTEHGCARVSEHSRVSEGEEKGGGIAGSCIRTCMNREATEATGWMGAGSFSGRRYTQIAGSRDGRGGVTVGRINGSSGRMLKGTQSEASVSC
ncbi:hypothetical protein P152DRAFT_459345 [Eremomyces bilateralis CBS 781.70]|uniref:Uncharacterized protein n=1 Tax=Eremomyces bilateralis CBS 781.70 TaxID=1392243 RepID=A0A6G1FZX2_9PEZI|nr:uncharacterized protein P152DRAFT_459345 [Eremomyces bilateralis CBS 781.70]KAF1811407.1 hypothetical protein P152DRAFT_459345 [Eremomyces bilateralis CBS 781.70]